MAVSVQRLLALMFVLGMTLTYGNMIYSSGIYYHTGNWRDQANLENLTLEDIGKNEANWVSYIEALNNPNKDVSTIQLQPQVIDERQGAITFTRFFTEGWAGITGKITENVYETETERLAIIIIKYALFAIIGWLIGLEALYMFYSRKTT